MQMISILITLSNLIFIQFAVDSQSVDFVFYLYVYTFHLNTFHFLCSFHLSPHLISNLSKKQKVLQLCLPSTADGSKRHDRDLIFGRPLLSEIGATVAWYCEMESNFVLLFCAMLLQIATHFYTQQALSRCVCVCVCPILRFQTISGIN